MSGKPAHSLFTILMNIIVLLAVALAVKVVLAFFGTLAAQEWAAAIIEITDIITPPFGVDAITTPYGGVFDVNAGLTVGGLLLLEWGLSAARDRA